MPDRVKGPVHLAGAILCGGAARRFGQQKALVKLAGAPLAAHAARRLAAQVERLVLCAGPNAAALAELAGLGHPLLPDDLDGAGPDGRAGPLAGVVAALEDARRAGLPGVVTAACDMPFLPDDLAARLLAAATEGSGRDARGGDAGIPRPAYAASSQGAHYVAALWPVGAAGPLREMAAAGRRALRHALDRLGAVPVSFADRVSFAESGSFAGSGADGAVGAGENAGPPAFLDINTPEDLRLAEAALARGGDR